MANFDYDLVVIGSGPGGYIGAIRAAQLGLNTAIIEKDSSFGGTCLNVGCIPSKALLESSELFFESKNEFSTHGIDLSGVKLNLSNMMKRKSKIVSDLTGGIDYLLKKNKVTTYSGIGKVVGQNEVLVTGKDKKTLSTKFIMLATGSVPVELPFAAFDEKVVVSSTGALALDKVPSKMVVIGGGAIGLELGSVWSRLGSEVTVLEFANKICGPMDTKLSKQLQNILKKQGMNIKIECKVTEVKKNDSKATVTFEDMKVKKTESIDCDVCLVAVGRRPFSEGLGLEDLGIEKTERGFVMVDGHLRTTKYDNIFAIGDLIEGPMLAHKAEEEGVAVVETMAGLNGHVNYNTLPNVIYTSPEVASVGKTEEELKKEGVPYNSGQFPFSANGRAKSLGHTEGFVKILAHKESDLVLGVHVIGPRASDVLAEAVVAMEFYASSEDLARSFHAHPTLSEVIREAALAVDGRARQM